MAASAELSWPYCRDIRREFVVTVSSDGHFAASGSLDGTICVWDLTSFRLCARLEGHLFTSVSCVLSALCMKQPIFLDYTAFVFYE